MTTFILNLFLAFAWVTVTGHFEPLNFFIGFILAYVMLWLVRSGSAPSNYFKKVQQVIGFIFFFGHELVKANLRVAWEVIRPGHHMYPGVVAIPLDIKTDAEITMLANLITLTPGTLTLDVSSDRKILYVHAMYIEDVDEFTRSIKEGFEKRVQEVLG
jgi:multicomponent Na+:H+ antiporter subunit E